MPKPHASTDECLLLIRLKRELAKAAMERIIVGFARPPHSLPDVTTLLEYLANMVYCIELMLKLLADTWTDHNIAKMYETVFGQPNPDPELMADIKTALTDQKYLFEPNGGLLAKIEGLELLHDVLDTRLRQRHDGYVIQVDIAAPPNFLAWVRKNVARFYVKRGPKDR